MNDLRLAWIAGLLEGEGCFDKCRTTPRVRVKMTDQDVIERFASFVNMEWPPQGREKAAHARPATHRDGERACWEVTLVGRRAVALMRAVQPLMGVRRQVRIIGVLAKWSLRHGS